MCLLGWGCWAGVVGASIYLFGGLMAERKGADYI